MDFGAGGLVIVLWSLAYVAILALVVWVIVRIARLAWYDGRQQPPSGPPAPREDSARQILRERYARGEIDAAEFEERRRRLLGL